MMESKTPPLGYTTKATIERWKDGDTVVVKIEKYVTIRLTDCWAPEVHKTDIDGEKEIGLKLSNWVKNLYPIGTHCVASFKGSEDDNFEDDLTLTRVLGAVYINGLCVNQEICNTGLAFPTKEQLTAYLKSQNQNSNN